MSSRLRLEPTPVTFAGLIDTNAAVDPKRAAVVCGDEARSWDEFRCATNRVANALLEGGLVKGDRVAMVMQNSISAMELMWGIAKAGGVIMPLSYLSTPKTLALQLDHARPTFVFCDQVGGDLMLESAMPNDTAWRWASFTKPSIEGWIDAGRMFAEASAEAPRVSVLPNDTISLMYSSGTTGSPKGIEHSLAAKISFATDYAMCLHVDRRTVSISTTPLYTNGTWTTMLPTIAAGGTVVLVQKFDPATLLELVERHRVTHAFLVPTQLARVMALPELGKRDLGSLETILTGAAPITADLLAQVADALPGTRVCENWGCTEGFSTFVAPDERGSTRSATVGRPMRGTEVKVIGADGEELRSGSVGELVGWGGALMKGYYRDPAKTEEFAWACPDGRTFVRSGDLGYVDDAGFVFLSGRVKDMIVSGGINVFPADIEEVLQEHPDVVEVVVIGVPHDDWGETPLALVRVRPESDRDVDAIRSWVNTRLGKYQRVSAVEIRDDFPRTSYNKVLKRELRDAYWMGSGRSF